MKKDVSDSVKALAGFVPAILMTEAGYLFSRVSHELSSFLLFLGLGLFTCFTMDQPLHVVMKWFYRILAAVFAGITVALAQVLGFHPGVAANGILAAASLAITFSRPTQSPA